MDKYKNIGLVVALEDESNNLIKEFGKEVKTHKIANFTIYEFHINEKKVFSIHSGVGEINSSIATTILLSSFNIDLIINFGLCGSLDKSLNNADIVLINEIIHYDFSPDTSDSSRTGVYLGRETNVFTVPKILLEDNIKYVRCASADKFVADNDLKSYLKSNLSCSICEMESAGINLACEYFNIDRIFVKSISDEADTNANVSFAETIQRGVTSYISILKKILFNV